MIFEGKLVGKGLKFAIVVSRFNEFITSKLLSAALDGLKSHEVEENDIDITWVPGAVEIPLLAKKMANTKKYDAIITLGAVIRGETTHYDYVCEIVSKGVGELNLEYGIPTIFGVITTENDEQAIERVGGKHGNKGYDAALSAIEMANLMLAIKSIG